MTAVLHSWLLAARPRTLTASLAPVMVGTALAVGFSASPVALGLAVIALLSALCIQIATNLVNDAADFRRGADKADRLGPVRVTQTGLLPGGRVMAMAGAVFVLAAVLGLPLIVAGGTPVLVIGVFSLAAGFAYTAGPYPLAYLGLGEVFVIAFFGFAAVKGMAYVLARQALSPWAELAAMQVGLQSATLLAINNLRDIAGDRRAGKWTLAARWGETFARIEIAVLVFAPFAIGTAWLSSQRPWAAIAPLLALPLAFSLVLAVRHEPPSAKFNRFLARSALLQLVFSALLALGLIRPFWP